MQRRVYSVIDHARRSAISSRRCHYGSIMTRVINDNYSALDIYSAGLCVVFINMQMEQQRPAMTFNCAINIQLSNEAIQNIVSKC